MVCISNAAHPSSPTFQSLLAANARDFPFSVTVAQAQVSRSAEYYRVANYKLETELNYPYAVFIGHIIHGRRKLHIMCLLWQMKYGELVICPILRLKFRVRMTIIVH